VEPIDVERTVEKRTLRDLVSVFTAGAAVPAQADRRPPSMGAPCPTRGSGQDPEPGPFDGTLVNDIRGDVLSRGADAARPKLVTGPMEKDTERRGESIPAPARSSRD
jgi:hypothetical protein